MAEKEDRPQREPEANPHREKPMILPSREVPRDPREAEGQPIRRGYEREKDNDR